MKKLDKPILAEGENTGHAHVVEGVDVFETEEGTRVFEARDKVIVKHEEHKEIELPAKEYEADRVIEYSHFDEEARMVQD